MAIVLLALFIAGNAQPMVSLLLNGRGHYKAALETIMEHSDGDKAVISGDVTRAFFPFSFLSKLLVKVSI